MAFFLLVGLAGLLAAALFSRLQYTNPHTLDVFSPCDILSNNSGQTLQVLDTDSLARCTSSLTYRTASPSIGGYLDNTHIPSTRALSSDSGDAGAGAVPWSFVVNHTPAMEESTPSVSTFSGQTLFSDNTTMKSIQDVYLGNGQVSNGGLQMMFLLGFFAATAGLVFFGFPLCSSGETRLDRNVFQFLKSSCEFDLCEELENVVPGFLLRNGLVEMYNNSPARFVPPLGYVVLTESGTCSIDPRPSRQITEEEDTNIMISKFGAPVEPLAHPRSPLAPLASCLAGSRPESPCKAPRKVTFANENEVFLFPCINVTKERNMRRRLSRRLNSAVATVCDLGQDNVPVAKGC